MIQELLTYIIIALAVIYVAYSILRFFRPAKTQDCTSCHTTTCGNCPLKAYKLKCQEVEQRNPIH